MQVHRTKQSFWSCCPVVQHIKSWFRIEFERLALYCNPPATQTQVPVYSWFFQHVFFCWPADRAGPGEIPRKTSGMKSAASSNSTMGSQSLEQTTARARAAVARTVLCPQPSTTLSGCSSHCSGSSSDSGRRSSGVSSQDPQSLPERESEEGKASTSQSPQRRDARHEGTTPCNDLQRNLLAQYRAESEESRMQGKAAEGARVTFRQGQPLQPLPEGFPSPFQVSVYIWVSS